MRVFSASLIVLVIGLFSRQAMAQVKPSASDDVVRTKTELVQTDVTVVDKRGRFVDGLTAEDFELRVDSKLQSLSFFEQVKAGSIDEERQLAAARKGDATPRVKSPSSVGERERVIFFFVDDVHLTGEGLNRARSLLTHFVENRVRTRKRFFDFRGTQNGNAPTAAAATNSPDDALKAALGSLYPRRDVPTFVATSFLKSADNSMALNLSMTMDGKTLGFDESSGNSRAVVDVLSIALDDHGRFASFKQKLEIPREVLTKDRGFIKWTQSLRLAPGLYQVRVAVRDRQTGRTGSAITWVSEN